MFYLGIHYNKSKVSEHSTVISELQTYKTQSQGV